MKVTLWGTRGSLAAPGPETIRYGGNTSCVEVRAADGRLLVLDAGTGIRRLGDAIERDLTRIDILLTHLHMDHIQGLGFFEPLFWPGLDVHLWGPSSTTYDLRSRLTRYLSPPLFPVRLRDLPCKLTFHNVVSEGGLSTGPFEVRAQLVCHPGPTVGYRIAADGASLAYLPDHEPALGALEFPGDRNWLSGIDLAEGVDLLIHDAQYTDEEYAHCVGWGHSSLPHLLTFARAARVRHLVPFHHDPAHSDVMLDELFAAARGVSPLPFDLTPAADGLIFDLAASKPPRGA